jgi:dolichol kinase
MTLTHEFYRKVLHLLLILIPLAYHHFGKWPTLMVLSPIATIVVSLDYFRRSNPKIKMIFAKIFAPILREHELDGDKLCGASFVALAACINFLLFKEEIAITSFLILIISDTLAALIGKSFPSQPFFEKSFIGSAAFFISGFIILLSCGAFFDSKAWFYLFGFFALFCVTIIEARPSFLKLDDNFTIPIVFSVIMTFFDILWNYSY